MLVKIGQQIINADQITCVARTCKPAVTLVYLAGHHDAYAGGVGGHSVPIRLEGEPGAAAWDYFSQEALEVWPRDDADGG